MGRPLLLLFEAGRQLYQDSGRLNAREVARQTALQPQGQVVQPLKARMRSSLQRLQKVALTRQGFAQPLSIHMAMPVRQSRQNAFSRDSRF